MNRCDTANRAVDSADPFEVLVSEHYEALFRFALSLTRSESDARDLTQQTFYIWASKGGQLQEPSKAKAWLFTTLHRGFLRTRRKEVRFPHHQLEEVSAELPFEAPKFANQEDVAQLLSAVARMDELFQPPVTLFYLEDYTYKEIAHILSLPLGTVKSRISRGIAQLREILLPEASSSSTPGCAAREDGSLVPESRGNPSAPSGSHRSRGRVRAVGACSRQ